MDLPTPQDDAPAAPGPGDRRLAGHGLVSTAELAAHYGITPASVRKLMSEHGVGEVRGYPAEAALNIQRPGRKPGPGRGHRKPPPDEETRR